MKRFISKIGSAITALLAMVAIIVAGLGIAATLPRDGPFKVLIVRSGSMEPTIPVGSLVIAQKQNQYGVGDIVTYDPSTVAQGCPDCRTGKESFVTHRIVAAIGDNFWVQGDANASPDGSPVPYSAVVGKLQWTVPYAGFAVNFARTPVGFSILIVFPALLIVIQEILAIGRELEKEKERRKRLAEKIFDMRKVPSRFALERQMMQESVGMRRRVTQAISMMLVAVVAGIGGTKAYFSDVAVSTANTFTAGTWGPQIATYVVINEVYYDPDAAHIQGNPNNAPDFEWIELYNPTGTTINLKDWKIIDGSGVEKSITTSNRDLPGYSFVILAKASNVRTLWGISNSIFIPIGENFGDGLGNAGDRVILKNNLGNIIDQMSYGTDIGIFNPSVPDAATGYSLERNPDGVDTNTAADFVDRPTPTPGT